MTNSNSGLRAVALLAVIVAIFGGVLYVFDTIDAEDIQHSHEDSTECERVAASENITFIVCDKTDTSIGNDTVVIENRTVRSGNVSLTALPGDFNE